MSIRFPYYHGTVVPLWPLAVSPSGLHFGSLAQASNRLSCVLAGLPVEVFSALPKMNGGQPGYIVRAALRTCRTKRITDQRDETAWINAVAVARSEGFDSLVYVNDFECPYQKCDSIIIFDSEQIQRVGRES